MIQPQLPDPTQSDKPVIVYIDIKSPYAYLSVGPTRALERHLGLRFDWRPFVLDIPSYLGSARLDKAGNVVEQQRSEAQWAGVKYAYYDCRRYARLSGLRIRGTEKIWDTQLVSAAMWWVRAQGAAVLDEFIDRVYAPFWVRELDVESETVIRDLLNALGAGGDSFLAWYCAAGASESAAFQERAFGEGIYGVPTYLVAGERYFGREHLPRVAWHIESGCASDAADDPDVRTPPDVAYTIDESIADEAAWSVVREVTVGVDMSLDSLLALPQLVNALRDFPGEVRWMRVPPKVFYQAPADNDDSRANVHRRCRLENEQANLRRYRPEGLQVSSFSPLIERLLLRHGIDLADAGDSPIRDPRAPGILVMLDDEPFIGRQHLPLVRRRLEHARGLAAS